MSVISFLGEEEFYTPLVTVIVWIVDAKLGRLLCLLMALGFYLTGVLKNLLCLPRPPCPPLHPLQCCNDWGLPSHHAVLSVNIPWYIWLYVYVNFDLNTVGLVLLFSVILLWSFCIMFSRMYLGVHSPADILTGGVVGCLLLAVWLLVDSAVDEYVASSHSSVLVILPLVVAMLCIHPDPVPTTIVFTETVAMVGVATGVVLGLANAPPFILHAAIERKHTYVSTGSLLGCCIARFVLGFTALLVSKEVVHWVVRTLLRYAGQLVGIPTVCVKRRSKVTSEHVHFSSAFTVLEEVSDVMVCAGVGMCCVLVWGCVVCCCGYVLCAGVGACCVLVWECVVCWCGGVLCWCGGVLCATV